MVLCQANSAERHKLCDLDNSMGSNDSASRGYSQSCFHVFALPKNRLDTRPRGTSSEKSTSSWGINRKLGCAAAWRYTVDSQSSITALKALQVRMHVAKSGSDRWRRIDNNNSEGRLSNMVDADKM